ncbi:albusnodin/ikarugamycin family macrolactam cyclase [Streptomyces sp. NPDC020799]|uniref:albusnodin/ikarugamycin family macrolactam cyclase n=1 Tax=Streptomyces sp. NPDC020799 TaxID=3365091 RepID=UPI0037AF5F6A
MRWFGGCAPAPGTRPVMPMGARLLWSDPPVWMVGAWPDRLVRSVDGGGARIAVFGSCSASAEDVVRFLTVDDLSAAVDGWAGSFTVVRVTGDGVVEVIADAAHACPVYTARFSGGVVWGSSSRALSGLVGGGVDADWLAAFLSDKRTVLSGRSAWEGVVPVPAGHWLIMRPGGGASVRPWWTPRLRSYTEAVPLVRRALLDGVRARVEGVAVSSDVAGMDSTTAAVIALRYGPVLGMTVHPEGVSEGGDVRYARALDLPGLTHTLFPLRSEHLPFSPADEPLSATDEPAPSSVSWAMLSAQLRAVADAGSACHLTGDGGDNLFLSPPTHLADLARRGRLLRMVRDAQAWARLRKVSPWPLVAAALRQDGGQLARPWLSRPPWLLSAAPAPRVEASADAGLVAGARGAGRLAYADSQLADVLGLELQNPYFDGAVLDVVASVPSWERFSVHRYKPLLVDAVGDLLPELHKRRVTKGVFAEDFHRGVRVNLRRLLSMAGGRLADLGLVDPLPLRAAIHGAALGAKTVWPPLLSALAAEMWLEVVETTPPVTWVSIEEGIG